MTKTERNVEEMGGWRDKHIELVAPFPLDDIEFRVGAMSADKTKALALAYITSRALMDRLDTIMGPENWQDEYKAGPDGGVSCGLSLRINDEWIQKWDVASNTDIEPVKGGVTDAFKRACYKWGLARYLYRIPNEWVSVNEFGKLTEHPLLPSWAMPEGETQKQPTVKPGNGKQPERGQDTRVIKKSVWPDAFINELKLQDIVRAKNHAESLLNLSPFDPEDDLKEIIRWALIWKARRSGGLNTKDAVEIATQEWRDSA